MHACVSKFDEHMREAGRDECGLRGYIKPDVVLVLEWHLSFCVSWKDTLFSHRTLRECLLDYQLALGWS
jgi:hypothetical protein